MPTHGARHTPVLAFKSNWASFPGTDALLCRGEAPKDIEQQRGAFNLQPLWRRREKRPVRERAGLACQWKAISRAECRTTA